MTSQNSEKQHLAYTPVHRIVPLSNPLLQKAEKEKTTQTISPRTNFTFGIIIGQIHTRVYRAMIERLNQLEKSGACVLFRYICTYKIGRNKNFPALNLLREKKNLTTDSLQ